MPKKPEKYGIRIWACSDFKTYYTSNIIRNQPQGSFSVDNTIKAQ